MRHRARITFRKFGDLRFIGHRDLVRLFERMLRRSGVELALSQGFHPKAKISFPLALAVGIEGAKELVEVEFSQAVEVVDLEKRLRECCPPGLEVLSVVLLDQGTAKPQPLVIEYRIPVPAEHHAATEQAICRFMVEGPRPIYREGRKAAIDARADVDALELRDGELCIALRVTRQANAGPRDVLRLLQLEFLEQQGAHLVRSAIRWNHDEVTISTS